MKKNVFRNIFLIFIIGIIIFYISIEQHREKYNKEQDNIYHESEINTKQEEINENNEKTNEENEVEEEKKIYPKATIIDEYKGYKVCAKIEIPAIELETYVLQNYSKQALNISPTKFWGANPNQIGNFCVAGHNFKNKNMFKNLKKLNTNDIIKVSDNNIGIIEYKIYNIEQVLPDNTNCLSQETNGKKEITLITCTSDSKKRIIIKAKE